MTGTEQSEALRAALGYAARGWAVLPLRGKAPAGGLVPRGAKDATTDAETISRWFADADDLGVGIACRADLAVLDIDPRGDDQGRSAHELLAAALPGGAPGGARVVATGGGGLHVYFAGPTAGAKLCDWADLKGEGGYVVAPPSRHASGRLYAVVQEGADPLPPLPGPVTRERPSRAPGEWKGVLSEPIREGGRHEAMARIAGGLLHALRDTAQVAQVVHAVNATQCVPPLPESEAQRIVSDLAAKDAARRGPRTLDLGQSAPAGTEGVGSGAWHAVDLSPLLAGIASGDITGPRPTLLRRSDGAALLYPGEVHIIAAEPESGKGWLMLAETAALLNGGERVLYVDFEDTALNIATRLLALGVDAATIAADLVYVRPEGAFTPTDLDALLDRGPYALAVLDGIGEAYSILGLNYAANEDVPLFVRQLVRPLAETGAAVVQIDHVTKAKEGRGRWAIGAQAKLATVAVAYGVEVKERPSREQAGRVALVLAKDRHGNIAGQRGDTVAVVHIVPEQGGDVVRVSVEPPTARDQFRPTGLMEKVSRFVETSPGASKRTIRGEVGGKGEYVDRATACLIEEGFIEVEADGSATRHRSVRAFREADDKPAPCPRVPPVSKRVPDTLGSDRVPVSSPLQGETRDTGHAAASDGGRVPVERVPLDRASEEADPDPHLAAPAAWWDEPVSDGVAA